MAKVNHSWWQSCINRRISGSLAHILVLAVAALVFSFCIPCLSIPVEFEELAFVVLLLCAECVRSRFAQSKSAKAANGKVDMEPRSSSSTTSPQTRLLNSLVGKLQAAAAGGDVRLAEDIMRNMWQTCLKPTACCYGALISACTKLGDVHGAERWLEELTTSNLGTPNTISVNIVLSAFAKRGDLTQAEACSNE